MRQLVRGEFEKLNFVIFPDFRFERFGIFKISVAASCNAAVGSLPFGCWMLCLCVV